MRAGTSEWGCFFVWRLFQYLPGEIHAVKAQPFNWVGVELTRPARLEALIEVVVILSKMELFFT